MLEIRILDIFKYSNLSRQDFSQKLGISNSVLSHLSSGRNKASIDLVTSILLHFPEINPEWLVLGHGEMKREQQSAQLHLIKNKMLKDIQKMKEDFKNNLQKLENLENELNSLE